MHIGPGDISTGMTAYGSDGEKLGKVIEIGASEFVVEKGFFSPKDYLLPYSCIDRREDDSLHLNVTRQQITEGRMEESRGAATSTGMASTTTGTTDEVRVPLVEEQVDVIKERHEAGSVNIRKEVTTEEKHFTVPVTKETVTVERTPVESGRRAAADTSFEEETIRVPVHEEEVEIRKRPVVREEIRVAKERHIEEQPVSETVRREEVEIEEEKIRAGDESGEHYKV